MKIIKIIPELALFCGGIYLIYHQEIAGALLIAFAIVRTRQKLNKKTKEYEKAFN